MLATLNLQLLSVEIPDDALRAPLSLMADDLRAGESGDLATGFADLLRLRVDSSPFAEDAGGELLPQGGSDLPFFMVQSPTEGSPESLTASTIDTGPVKPAQASGKDPEPGTQAEAVDLLLDTAVIYPPPAAVATAAPATLNPQSSGTAPPPVIVPLTTPAADLTRPVLATGDGSTPETAPRRPLDVPRIAHPPMPTTIPTTMTDGRESQMQRNVTEIIGPTPALPGLRETGQMPVRSARAARVIVTAPNPEAADKVTLPSTGVARPDALPQRTDTRADLGAELLQPRTPVTQATQLPQAAQTPQTSQPPLPVIQSLAPATTRAPDVTYATVSQPSTDMINASVRDSAWAEQVGDRVVMMAGNQLKQAEIRLTPAELGPLRVQVAVDDGAAHVTFHAQHAVTREALEQALPRLREMLAENGLSLGQADVSERDVSEGSRDRGSETGPSAGAEDTQDADIETGPDAPRRLPTPNGLVDTFA